MAWAILRLLVASRLNESIAAGEGKPKQPWKKGFSYATLAMAGVFLAVLMFNLSSLYSELGPLYTRLNDNLPSLLISGAAIGFIGWVLLQTWAIYRYRQRGDARKWAAKQAENDFEETEKFTLERRRAANARRAAQTEQRHSILDSPVLDRDSLRKALTTIEDTLAKIEQVVSNYCKSAKYEQRNIVRNLTYWPRNNYVSLIGYMLEADVVQPAAANRWRNQLTLWATIKESGTDRAERALQEMLADTSPAP